MKYLPDHPEIVSIEQTGYPTYCQPSLYFCIECGNEIEGEIYEDEKYEFLCEKCLLMLHKKVW